MDYDQEPLQRLVETGSRLGMVSATIPPPSPTFVLGIVEIVAENPSKPGIIAGARACSPLIDGGTEDKSLNWDQ